MSQELEHPGSGVEDLEYLEAAEWIEFVREWRRSLAEAEDQP